MADGAKADGAIRRLQRLGRRARGEALALAELSLTRGLTYGQTIRALQQRYAIGTRTAERLIAELHKRWAAEADHDRPHRHELARRRLLELYRAARTDRRYADALRAELLLLRLDGLLDVERDRLLPTHADEFAGRTDEDLEFYIREKCWPEDAPIVEGETEPQPPLPMIPAALYDARTRSELPEDPWARFARTGQSQ